MSTVITREQFLATRTPREWKAPRKVSAPSRQATVPYKAACCLYCRQTITGIHRWWGDDDAHSGCLACWYSDNHFCHTCI